MSPAPLAPGLVPCADCGAFHNLLIVCADLGDGAFLDVLCATCWHRRQYLAELKKRKGKL
jgi:hypothetical protein